MFSPIRARLASGLTTRVATAAITPRAAVAAVPGSRRLKHTVDETHPPSTANPGADVTLTVEEKNSTPTDSSWGFQNEPLVETAEQARALLASQAPNRVETWSRSQMPRAEAMSGPRFEQTIMEAQPRPYSAMELIHRQPVKWTHEHVVSCDGGGGPLGHPRIFINTDKPQIAFCEYCGNPFANEHNRKAITADPNPPYPLE